MKEKTEEISKGGWGKKLQTATINAKSIGRATFSGCTGLKAVIIGESVESIGNHAFSGCTSLKDIYYAGDETQWEGISKGSVWDEYYSDNSYHPINYQLHYNSTGHEGTSATSEAAGAQIFCVVA